MVFKHYVAVNGVDIANSEATANYVRNLAPQLAFKPSYLGDRIHIALQDQPYRSPLLDHAPWSNPNDPTTDDFYGFHPTDISGISDSTLSSSITENLDNGGSTNTGREASRTVKVSGLIVAKNAHGAQVGLTWLRAAVRDDGCDSGNCQGGGFNYFLSEPNVVEHAYGDESGYLERSFGGQGMGYLSYRWPLIDSPVDMPSRARWDFTATEGTSLMFGAVGRFDTTDLKSSGPVQPYRVNYLPNPTLYADLTGWTVTGGQGDWYASGGADGGSYGRLTPPVQSSTAGAYGTGPYGAGPYGGTGTITVAQSTTAAPVAAGNVVSSVALRGQVGQQVSIVLSDGVGAVIAQQALNITDQWVRYSIAGVLAAQGLVTLSVSSNDILDYDEALVEIGQWAFPYFDGSHPSDLSYVTTWAGTPNQSASVQRWNDIAEICRDDSDYRPYINILQGSLTALTLGWFTRPELSMDDQLEPYLRSFYDVTCTQGPQIIQEIDAGVGGYFIQVEMLFGVGNPFAYSPPKLVDTTPLLSATFTDSVPVVLDDSWLVDPDCTPVTLAPSAPAVLDDCIETISSWQRYYVSIPAEDVADWASSVPTLTFDAKDIPIQQVRVRFHPNPFGYDPQRVDPLSYCSEFTISYLPPTTRLQVNGALKKATASKTGKATVPANHLLYGSDGAPVSWPELSCGVPYVLTVDVPPSSTFDLFDLGLELQRRE